MQVAMHKAGKPMLHSLKAAGLNLWLLLFMINSVGAGQNLGQGA